MSEDKVPKIQRALVIQGGGAIGAYNAGVFQALYDTLPKEDEGKGQKGIKINFTLFFSF